jgi:hypothetical protein
MAGVKQSWQMIEEAALNASTVSKRVEYDSSFVYQRRTALT